MRSSISWPANAVDANKMNMKPYAKDRFFFENATVVAEFKRDANGNVLSLLLANKRGISSSILKRTDKPIPGLP